MKHIFLKSLFLLLGALSALSAVAYDVRVGDGYYNLNKSDATAVLTYLLFYDVNNAEAYEGDIVIPETFEHDGITYTVKAVDARAFFACNRLTSIELPSTITEIGSNAFINCSALKSITLPEKLSTIGNAAFQGCSSLESVELPITLVSLGATAFSGCINLQNIVFPPTLRTIDSNTFLDCTALTHIDLPRSLTSIGVLAFSGCTGLESVVFPDNLTDIKGKAFQYCTGLKRIELGKSIRVLDVLCFSGCTNLADVYCASAAAPIETFSNAFSGIPRLRLHVPNEGVEAYHKVDTWAGFKSILPLQCEIPTLEITKAGLTFSTATNLNYADVSENYTYSIEVSDICSGTITQDEMDAFGELGLTYDIHVKATAEGCEDSDEVAAQLCWIDSEYFYSDDEHGVITAIEAPAAQRPLLATSRDGAVTITGLADGERVVLYDLSGRQLCVSSAFGGTASFSVADSGGASKVVVVRVGNSSFKVRVN